MTLEEIEKFEAALTMYHFGYLQDITQFLETLKQQGYTLDDFQSYVKAKRKALQESSTKVTEVKTTSQQCSKCSALMLLLPVNDKPETQTGDPTDKSVWMCQKCMHTIYNKQTLKELRSKGGN